MVYGCMPGHVTIGTILFAELRVVDIFHYRYYHILRHCHSGKTFRLAACLQRDSRSP